jgi:hypothetical protein
MYSIGIRRDQAPRFLIGLASLKHLRLGEGLMGRGGGGGGLSIYFRICIF